MKIEEIIHDEEKIIDKIVLGEQEAVITDRRLLLHNKGWASEYFQDILLSKINSIKTFRSNRPQYLIYAGLSISVWFLLPHLFNYFGIQRFIGEIWNITQWILIIIAIGCIIAYFLTRKTGLTIHAVGIDPINLTYEGKKAESIVERLIKGLRHREDVY